MNWYETVYATHGVFLNEEQSLLWEEIMKKRIPDIKGDEICRALEEAMDRDEPTAAYRLTVKDIIDWVHKSRRNWGERVEIKNGVAYFIDRPRICGQIQSRKATMEESKRRP